MPNKLKGIIILLVFCATYFAGVFSFAKAYSPNPSTIPGECVWWAWERWPQANGPLPKGSDFGLDGDAYQWIWMAQHSGFPTGTTPKTGAVAVWDKWIGGARDKGHVAYVEQTGANGQFLVSEYNWSYYHQKDTRWVTWQSGINFIYPKGSTAITASDIHDYDRIKGSGAGIFFVERGKKRWIPNTDTLLRLNSRYGGDVKVVDDSVLNSFAFGRQVPDIWWPNNHENVLLKGSTPAVFVMKNGQLHLISNMDQFDADGDFYYPSDIREISDTELSTYPIGVPIYNNGDLFVRLGTVYVIERNKRRGIPNPDTFNARGYSGHVIYTPPAVWVDMIPIGRMMPDVLWNDTHDDVLLKGSTNAVFVMKNGQRHLLSSMDQTDEDGDFYYPSDIRIVSDEEINSIVIGPPIYNEGDLFRNKIGVIFVIERGKRRGIPNAETFNQRHYNWGLVYTPPDDWLNLIPIGRNIPDVNWPDTYDDVLLQEDGSNDLWVMRNGTRWYVPSFDTIAPDGDFYYPSDVRKIDSLASIPVGNIDISLTLKCGHAFWASQADYQARKLSVTYTLINSGNNPAYNAKITDAVGTNGVVIFDPLPYTVGDLEPGAKAEITLHFTVPPNVHNFRSSLKATAEDANKASHSFP